MSTAAMTTLDLATRHVGTCQICQNAQKLTASGRMVHRLYLPESSPDPLARVYTRCIVEE